ncbi:MAG: hypothetical protein IBJ03_17875 [Gemmatimonadaceae bacterium]|nr:hypothetical protein [Gemmatimonadaceae bacterium]
MKRILFAFVAVAGCGESPTAGYDQLTVSTTVSPVSAKVGDAIHIRTVLRNEGQSAVITRGAECGTGFEVLSGGVVVAPGPVACTAALPELRKFAAGDSIVVSLSWHGNTRSSFGTTYTTLEPGTYSIRGVIRVGEATFTSEGHTVVLLP